MINYLVTIFFLVFSTAFAGMPDFFTRDLLIDPYPEVVGIVRKINDGYNIYCSGVAVSKTKIITAAHCVAYGDGSELKYPLNDYKVHVGEGVPDQNLGSDEVKKLFEVKSIDFHPLYGKGEYQFSHDIAVITLKRKIDGNFNFRPIDSIPSGDYHLSMVGFGVREDSESGSWVTSDLKSFFLFDMNLIDRYVALRDEEINELAIIDLLKDKGNCKGDSGGPMFIETTQGRFLYAITTTGPMKEYPSPTGGISLGRCGFDSRATLIDKHLSFLQRFL